MQVIFLLCHCPTALSYIYFIVLLWWLLRAFVSFCASVKNIYGFYNVLRGRPSIIIEEIQRCHIKAAFCIPTGICRYYQAGGVCLSAVHVWSEEVTAQWNRQRHRKTHELLCPCCGRAGSWPELSPFACISGKMWPGFKLTSKYSFVFRRNSYFLVPLEYHRGTDLQTPEHLPTLWQYWTRVRRPEQPPVTCIFPEKCSTWPVQNCHCCLDPSWDRALLGWELCRHMWRNTLCFQELFIWWEEHQKNGWSAQHRVPQHSFAGWLCTTDLFPLGSAQ